MSERSTLTFRDEVTDSYSGQLNGRLSAYEDGIEVGYADWVEYDGETSINYIHVNPERRRQGIGTQILSELKRSHKNVVWTSTTPDGTSFKSAVDPYGGYTGQREENKQRWDAQDEAEEDRRWQQELKEMTEGIYAPEYKHQRESFEDWEHLASLYKQADDQQAFQFDVCDSILKTHIAPAVVEHGPEAVFAYTVLKKILHSLRGSIQQASNEQTDYSFGFPATSEEGEDALTDPSWMGKGY